MNHWLKLSLSAALIFGLATAVPAAAQNGNGYFEWPLGRKDERGVVAPGHDLKVLFDYGLTAGGEAHGGVDLIWSTGDNRRDGTATIGAPIYAVADGKLACENRGTAYTMWPGRVIVVEHTLANGDHVYSLRCTAISATRWVAILWGILSRTNPSEIGRIQRHSQFSRPRAMDRGIRTNPPYT